MTLALIVWVVMTILPALEAIKIVFVVFAGITLFVAGLIWLITEGEHDGGIKIWLKQLKWSLPLFIFLILVPNTQTAWYMVGAYAAEQAATSEMAGEVGTAAKEMMLELMKKAKEEIKQIDAEAVKDSAVEAVKGQIKEAT